jgi:hypothetical protein
VHNNKGGMLLICFVLSVLFALVDLWIAHLRRLGFVSI